MTPTLTQRAQAYLEVAEKASKPPWTLGDEDSYPPDSDYDHMLQFHDGYKYPEDYEFIVAARANSPALVRDLLAENERLRAALLEIEKDEGIDYSWEAANIARKALAQ